MRSPWDMNTCISRGIKENMQRKSHWKDKCVGTLWRTQKWKPSLGNNIRFYSPWTCSEFSLILSFAYSVAMALPCFWLNCSWWKCCCIAVFRKLLATVLFRITLSRKMLINQSAAMTDGSLQFSGSPQWKSFVYCYDDFDSIADLCMAVLSSFFFIYCTHWVKLLPFLS